MRPFALAGCAALALLAVGCGDSVAAHSGAEQSFRVTDGQFFEGAYPSANGGPDVEAPENLRNSVVAAGFTGKKIGGLTPKGSRAVALNLAGFGSGYWVVPVGSPDPLTNELTWSATMDFGRDLPGGDVSLTLAASDGEGRFGQHIEKHLTMLPFAPEDHVVASLVWGNDADLDLHIVSPTGKELDPKHPNTGALDADGVAPLGSGLLDRDSNNGCIPDGTRNENVSWKDDPDVDGDSPEPGTYIVRVDMFSACGKPAADFVFILTIDGQEVLRKVGRLLDADADNGGPGSGLFVTEFTL